MLKAGIELAHAVTTVSETYAKEIIDPYFACGLEDILQKRSYKISGIVNGIDTALYDPSTDPSLFQRYSIKSIARKKKNKEGLQEMISLPVTDRPLIGMVSRLTNQKGLDLLMEVIDEILKQDVKWSFEHGDWKYETP